jgi:hypothetical protein
LLAYSLKVISHYGPLGGASVAVVQVENMDEASVAIELEHPFGENPAAFDGEKRAVSPDHEGIPIKGAPDNEDHAYVLFWVVNHHYWQN